MTAPTLKLQGAFRHSHTNAAANLVVADPDTSVDWSADKLGIGMKSSSGSPTLISDFESVAAAGFLDQADSGSWSSHGASIKMSASALSLGAPMTQNHYIFTFLAPNTDPSTALTVVSNPVKIR